MNTDEQKAKIRKEIRRRREGLSSKVLSKIDKTLPGFIFSIEDDELQSKLNNARRIALYRAFKGEVPVDHLADELMARGITCCFPRIEKDNMVFCDCNSLEESGFCRSSFGISEPVSSKEPVDPEDIDVVVLPAVAYNEEGTRLGAGGGYYDRFIASYKGDRPYLLGICYEFQICSDIPCAPHDISADFIAVIPEEEYGE